MQEIKTIENKLMADAHEAYDELRNMIISFPHRCCKFAAKEMHKKGYDIVSGIIYLDNYCNMNEYKQLVHYWNHDKDSGKFIDITSAQFDIHLNKRLPQIFVWKDEKTIYMPKKIGITPFEVI